MMSENRTLSRQGRKMSARDEKVYACSPREPRPLLHKSTKAMAGRQKTRPRGMTARDREFDRLLRRAAAILRNPKRPYSLSAA